MPELQVDAEPQPQVEFNVELSLRCSVDVDGTREVTCQVENQPSFEKRRGVGVNANQLRQAYQAIDKFIIVARDWNINRLMPILLMHDPHWVSRPNYVWKPHVIHGMNYFSNKGVRLIASVQKMRGWLKSLLASQG